MKPLLTTLIFLSSSLLVIGSVMVKPQIRISLGKNYRFKLETYFLAALLGPLFLFAFGLLSPAQSLSSLFSTDVSNPLKILVLFFSMVFLSTYLDKTGFFAWCAQLSFKASGGNPKALFFVLYASVSILTIFTSNDIVILTFTPFIYHFAIRGNLNPLPFLIAEFFAANTFSMILYIGNPTNIFLASAFSLDFFTYARWMFLPGLTAGVCNLVLLYLTFKKDLLSSTKIQFDNSDIILKDKPGTLIGTLHLAAAIVLLSLAPYIHLEMWSIAAFTAVSLILILFMKTVFTRKESGLKATFSSLPWPVIPFIISMFLMVNALASSGITLSIAQLLDNTEKGNLLQSTLTYGISSALLCNIINNIPMTVALGAVLSSGTHSLSNILAVALGSNLGANFTPIGALAGIMWMSILKEKSVNLSFATFTGYGLKISGLTLIASLLVLAFQFMLWGKP